MGVDAEGNIINYNFSCDSLASGVKGGIQINNGAVSTFAFNGLGGMQINNDIIHGTFGNNSENGLMLNYDGRFGLPSETRESLLLEIQGDLISFRAKNINEKISAKEHSSSYNDLKQILSRVEFTKSKDYEEVLKQLKSFDVDKFKQELLSVYKKIRTDLLEHEIEKLKKYLLVSDKSKS